MHIRLQDSVCTRALIRAVLLVFGMLAVAVPGWVNADETSEPPAASSEESKIPAVPKHLSESVRSSVRKVVVLPGASPAGQAVTGSYRDETKGLLEGSISGSEIGKGVWTEVGGVSVGIPFPILTLPGALIGGISGATKREVQEFRDDLTKDLANAASQPLTNDALASDVFWGIRKLPNLDSKVFAPTTPIPADTDAILYVSFTDLTIDIQGKDAIITTTASATLRRVSDGEHLYENDVKYQDRDTLSNWTKNENALWHDYANFARHYIGREISAEVFDQVELNHELRPIKTDTVAQIKKNEWQGISRTLRPTLAWELTLLGGDSYGPWTTSIDESNVFYNVEIYDLHRLVYSAKKVQGSKHTVAEDLEACQIYRWSVRPAYHVGSDIKFGEWMRFNSETYTAKANVGRQVSEAPAYLQDFPSLKIKCGSR